MTMATIGRTNEEAVHRGQSAGDRDRAGVGRGRGGFRIHHRAWPRFLRALHDNPVASLEALFDDPTGTNLAADLHRLELCLVVAADHRHLVAALGFDHRALRHHDGIRLELRLGPHQGVLAGSQRKLRVRKEAGNAQSAGGQIHLPASIEEPALTGEIPTRRIGSIPGPGSDWYHARRRNSARTSGRTVR